MTLAIHESNAEVPETAQSPATARPLVFACALVIAAGFLGRIATLHFFEAGQVADAQWYLERARGIASGLGYCVEGRPTAYWPVGYPALVGAFMSVLGQSVLVAQYLNAALSLGIVALTGVLARRLGCSPSVAWIAAAIVAALPSQVFACFVTSSEIPHAFLSMLAIVALLAAWRSRSIAMSLVPGLLFGLATLVRPETLLLPVFLIPAFWRMGVGPMRLAAVLRRSGVLLVAVGAVLVPWTIRNFGVFGELVPVSTNGGINLLCGNCDGATGRLDEEHTALALRGTAYEAETNEARKDRIARDEAVRFIVSRPLKALAIVPSKVWYTYRSDVGVLNWIFLGMKEPGAYGGPLRTALAAATQVSWCALLAAFAAGVVRKLRGSWTDDAARAALGLAIASTAFVTTVHAVFFGGPRFHFVLVPLFALVAAHLALETAQRIRARRAAAVHP